ncbi:hypothetical protein QN277_006359 [Acacia crassicarpa]|uniref:Uncharacterized protein n=1 Tax=Acacia crassicarpa TaxID=499986 RepID=A0AAE1IV42_9FABA|nr:hypothetical protein QN277_006359 [Acacia crassicarpa]
MSTASHLQFSEWLPSTSIALLWLSPPLQSEVSSLHRIVHCDPLLNGKGFLRRLGFSFKVDGKVRAVISGEGDLLSRLESGNNSLALKEAIDPIQIRQQLDTIAFGTLTEQTGPYMTRGSCSNINELDLDHPTKGFSSIPDAMFARES